MKIVVFGASGGIGKFVVKHALKEGYKVNAYVRNPSKLDVTHDNLNIIQGQLNEYDKIKRAIEGCDTVISALGVPMKFTYESMDALNGTKNIVKAMCELKVSRIITWSTPSVKFSRDKKSFITIIPGIMASILFPKAKKEVIAIADLLQQNNLDWTIVRFMAPKNTAFTGAVKVGFGDIKMSFNISREDIAEFILQQTTSLEYLHSMPIIGS